MPLFSFIVPVYNVKEYLEKCIASLLAQRCGDYEILLIDDGSTDGSGELCDRLAARNTDKVRAIHQKNSGAGEARNRGIDLSKGTYLLFIDSDDYISDTLLTELSKKVKELPAELYLFGALVERDGRFIEQLHEAIPANTVVTAAQAPELFFGIMAPWNKVYHRRLFDDSEIRFPSKVWYEDIRVSTKILAVAKSIVRLDGAYYHYIQREGSAMRNTNCERNAEILDAFDDILGWFRGAGLWEQYHDELCYLTICHVLIAASVRVIQVDRKHRLIEEFRTYTQQNFPAFGQCKHLAQLDKSKALIYRLLLKKRYRSIRMIFRMKALLER